MTDKLRVAMTTFGYLYRSTLGAALESIAVAGYRTVEIAVVPPLMHVTAMDQSSRKQLKRRLDDLHLTCVSVNPVELNLISSNPEIRELAWRHYAKTVELAHDLGAPVVVVVPGRQNAFIPMPREEAVDIAVDQLSRLVKVARDCGVSLAVETVPFGFTETAAEVLELVSRVGDPCVGIAVDVANTYGKEDIEHAVATAGSSILIAHLSDTWRHRWAHTSLGRGEIDFPEYLAALRRHDFRGPCVYELVDGEDPDPRIAADLATLEKWGWSA